MGFAKASSQTGRWEKAPLEVLPAASHTRTEAFSATRHIVQLKLRSNAIAGCFLPGTGRERTIFARKIKKSHTERQSDDARVPPKSPAPPLVLSSTPPPAPPAVDPEPPPYPAAQRPAPTASSLSSRPHLTGSDLNRCDPRAPTVRPRRQTGLTVLLVPGDLSPERQPAMLL
jgi:hypothetical protein